MALTSKGGVDTLDMDGDLSVRIRSDSLEGD